LNRSLFNHASNNLGRPPYHCVLDLFLATATSFYFKRHSRNFSTWCMAASNSLYRAYRFCFFTCPWNKWATPPNFYHYFVPFS